MLLGFKKYNQIYQHWPSVHGDSLRDVAKETLLLVKLAALLNSSLKIPWYHSFPEQSKALVSYFSAGKSSRLPALSNIPANWSENCLLVAEDQLNSQGTALISWVLFSQMPVAHKSF